jgi:RNA-directed DNA polymerase
MPRLDRQRRKYSLVQSPLYRLSNRRRLAEILAFADGAKALDQFVARSDNYREFVDNGREIQAPRPQMEQLHRNLAKLLIRIASPEYLHSGICDRSYVSNARTHQSRMPAIKVDIRRFYPSTSWDHVFRLFRNSLECSPDVAGVIATLSCCAYGHIPTGSPLSQILAFHAHRTMFDAIAEFAHSKGGIASVYVDDIVVSMPHANMADLRHVERIISRHGLSSKKQKRRLFRSDEPKLITGVIVKPTHLEAPNRLHQKFGEALAALAVAEESLQHGLAARKAIGIAQSIAYVDPRYVNLARHLRNKYRSIAYSTVKPAL